MKLDIEEVISDFMTNTDLYTGESVLVGERQEFGISVFVEGVVSGSDGAVYPEVSVWADDDLVYDETVYSKEDFRECLAEVSDAYLSGRVPDILLRDECGADDEEEEDICAREEELDSAVRDFLNVVYQCDPFEGVPDEDETIEEIKDQLLCVLADFDSDIYRPTEIDGKIEEYPYAV